MYVHHNKFPSQLDGFYLFIDISSSRIWCFCRFSLQTGLIPRIQPLLQDLYTKKIYSRPVTPNANFEERERSHRKGFQGQDRTSWCTQSRSLSGRIRTSSSSRSSNRWSRGRHRQPLMQQRKTKSIASDSFQRSAGNKFPLLSRRPSLWPESQTPAAWIHTRSTPVKHKREGKKVSHTVGLLEVVAL